MNLYSSVERLLSYHQEGDSAHSASTPTSAAAAESAAAAATSAASVRCILFHELCPALHAIMADGMKPEVITSFGRMPTSVWRLVEAVVRQGGGVGGVGVGGGGVAAGGEGSNNVSDLVMLLNDRFSSKGEEERKFAGFIAGMLK